MKITVNSSDFHDAFRKANRLENFSYEGREVLFDYLESLEQDTSEEMELDVIALCCDFYEGDYEQIAQDYGIDLSDCEDDEDKANAVREYLEDEGALVGEVDGGFVYQAH